MPRYVLGQRAIPTQPPASPFFWSRLSLQQGCSYSSHGLYHLGLRREQQLCAPCMFRLGRICLCPCICNAAPGSSKIQAPQPPSSRCIPTHAVPSGHQNRQLRPYITQALYGLWISLPALWPGVLNQAEAWRLRECSRTGETDSRTALPGAPIHSTGIMLSRCSIKRKGRRCIILSLLANVSGMFVGTASYKLSKMSWTSLSASSMTCSGAYCGFHPILLPCSAVKVHLEASFVSLPPLH